MRFKSLKIGILVISVLLMLLVIPNSLADNYARTYTFNVQFGQDRHTLYVSVPPSLYDYYHGKTHSLSYDWDYSRFVTPSVFESVADNLRNATHNLPYSDEEFADAVLMMVHQVAYVVGDMKYPVETLVDNSGKCDTLSLLAASIMKAGGLDVVLLYYEGLSPSHINVGVYLPYKPAYHTWWMTPKGYEYNNRTYWMAECTHATDWKVGDCPQLLAKANATIISVENCEESSPARVSSSLDVPLTLSSISINLSSDSSSVGDGVPTLTVSGSISPEYTGESVVMYVNRDGTPLNTFRTETDHSGKYAFTWNFTSTGTYYIKTSWSGTSNYAGADSETLTVFIGFPKSSVQFEGLEYEYIYGFPSVAAYELRVRQGVKDFLDVNSSGTEVLLTGEFIMLRSGQTVTISRRQTLSSGQTITIADGEQPLRLPDDYNLTINNQFCFILRNNGGNSSSLDVKGLNYYDMSQIEQSEGNETALMNASTSIRENTWYSIVARMSEDGITAELHDANGTLLESRSTRNDAADTSELEILLANNTDRAVVFKNLQVETLNQTVQPPGNNKNTVNGNALAAPYVDVTILVAAAFAAVIYVVRKRRRSARPSSKGLNVPCSSNQCFNT
jgi:hypothetical protein